MSVSPQDATGTYPALAGCVPVTTGRRAAARLLDGAIGTALVVLVLAAGSSRSSTTVAIVALLLYVALQLWAYLFRGARIGGLILGQRFVSVATGEISGARTLLKYLLQGALAVLTFGLVELIMSVASLRPPLNRNWFDRTTGLMLVDARAGRGPRVAASAGGATVGRGTAAPSTTVPATIAAVEMPEITSLPGPASAGGTTPQVTEVSSWDAPSWLAGSPDGSGPAGPAISQVGVADVNGDFIEATPFGRAPHRVAETRGEPPVERPQVVVRDHRPAPADATDATVLTPDAALAGTPVAPPLVSGAGAFLRLDDGVALDLSRPIVVGRNPQRPPGAIDVEPRAIPDPSMSLSKSHAVIGRSADGVWVTDLHSTNGVRVAPGDGRAAERIRPGERVVVPVGGRLEFGGRSADVVAG